MLANAMARFAATGHATIQFIHGLTAMTGGRPGPSGSTALQANWGHFKKGKFMYAKDPWRHL